MKLSRSRHQLPAGVTHTARLWPNDHGFVIWLRNRIQQLKLKVANQDAPNGLDLKVGKVASDATMATSAKPDESKRRLLVLLSGWGEPVRVIL